MAGEENRVDEASMQCTGPNVDRAAVGEREFCRRALHLLDLDLVDPRI